MFNDAISTIFIAVELIAKSFQLLPPSAECIANGAGMRTETLSRERSAYRTDAVPSVRVVPLAQ